MPAARFRPILLLLALQAVPPPPSPLEYRRLVVEAERLLEAKDFEKAIPLLERSTEQNPRDGSIWRMLGDAHAERKDHRAAIAAWTRAIGLGFLDRAEGNYRISTAHALAGDRRSALDFLKKALADRYRWRPRIATDKRFESLAADPEFRRIAGLDPPPADRVRGWNVDLDLLVSEVRRVHYRYSREPLPATFLREVGTLREAIPRSSDAEVVIRLQRLTALLGDGHSLVFPFGMNRGMLRRIPLTLYFFADGLFVIDAFEEWRSLVGRRVESLGGVDPEGALDRLREFVSHDNEMSLLWTAPVYLTFTDYLRAIGATKDPQSVRIALAPSGSAGRREVVVRALEGPIDPDAIATRLAAPVSTEPPAYLRRSGENFWFEKVPDGKTVYFQFNRVLDAEKETLSAFAIRLRRFLEENTVDNLIVDVRLNNGGEGRLLTELVRTVAEFEMESPDRRVLVLIGRNTFSAAQQFVTLLDALASPLFVGEPTGSRPKRAGDEAPFVLPYSGVRGALASGFHQIDGKDERIWLVPDLPVALSSSDYFANRDPVLDAALAWIRSGRF